MSDFVKIRVTYPSQDTDIGGSPVSERGTPASPCESGMVRSGGPTRLALTVIGVVMVGGVIGAGFMFSGASDPASSISARVGADATANLTEEDEADAARAKPEPSPLRTTITKGPGAPSDKEAFEKVDDESVAQFETGSAPPTEVVETTMVEMAPPPKPANEAPPAAMMPPPVKKPETKVSAIELAAGPDGSVARSQLTSAVRGREPVDRLSSRVKIGESGGRKLFYFTELKGLNGETIFHRWEHDGRTIVTLRFNVGSDRWRAYSSKMIPSHQAGDWRVLVANAEGDVLASSQFVAE